MKKTTRRRWSDHDKTFGPFTYSYGYRHTGIVLVSGDGDEYAGCMLRIHFLKHTLIVNLPPIIKPYREKVIAHWDAATVARMGRDWYYNYDEREYGFSISDGDFLQIYYGRQSQSSKTEKRKGYFFPWKQWTHVRHSIYDLNGNLFATEPEEKKFHHLWQRKSALYVAVASDTYTQWREKVEACPTRSFLFNDFDGEEIICKTHISEREWHRGTGDFAWLRYCYPPKVHRSLDLEFSKETGRRKGSWKGGTTGHSIEMLPGELHEEAFKRYCAGDDSRAGTKRDMTFIREIV